MKTLIIKIAFICVLIITVIGCQSTKISNTADIEITKSENFTLNTEATFRPIIELRSIPEPAEYSETILESHYEYFPDWSTLKKADGGDALVRAHDRFTWEWKKISASRV